MSSSPFPKTMFLDTLSSCPRFGVGITSAASPQRRIRGAVSTAASPTPRIRPIAASTLSPVHLLCVHISSLSFAPPPIFPSSARSRLCLSSPSYFIPTYLFARASPRLPCRNVACTLRICRPPEHLLHLATTHTFPEIPLAAFTYNYRFHAHPYLPL